MRRIRQLIRQTLRSGMMSEIGLGLTSTIRNGRPSGLCACDTLPQGEERADANGRTVDHVRRRFTFTVACGCSLLMLTPRFRRIWWVFTFSIGTNRDTIEIQKKPYLPPQPDTSSLVQNKPQFHRTKLDMCTVNISIRRRQSFVKPQPANATARSTQSTVQPPPGHELSLSPTTCTHCVPI